jgi:hypothetical protein
MILAIAAVDGVLAGGASLTVESLTPIITAAHALASTCGRLEPALTGRAFSDALRCLTVTRWNAEGRSAHQAVPQQPRRPHSPRPHQALGT